MKRFFFGELAFSGKLTPSVSPPFSKSENGGKTPSCLPQIPFVGIWGRQEGVSH